MNPDMSADNVFRIQHLEPNLAWLAQRNEDIIEPGLPIVDAHHHLWAHSAGYLLDDLLEDVATGHNVVASVYVQCGHAYRSDGPEELKPVGETAFAASVAERARQRGCSVRPCAGIVGWADLRMGDAVESVLQAHVESGRGGFRGIRQLAARDEHFSASVMSPSPKDLLVDPAFQRGFARLGAMGLTFEAWVYHHQLHQVEALAAAHPQVPIALNHFGGPLGIGVYRERQPEVFASWRANMRALARHPNIYVKLGGLGMVTSPFRFHELPEPPSSEELARSWRPWMDTVMEFFDARRCMFESNFPVDKGMFSYAVMWNAFKRLCAGASAAEKAALFNGTATAFYRLSLDAHGQKTAGAPLTGNVFQARPGWSH